MRTRRGGWGKAALAAALAAAFVASAVALFPARDAPARSRSQEVVPAGDGLRSRPVVAPEEGPPVVAPDAAPISIAAAGDIACDPANPDYHGGRGLGDHCRAAETAKLIGNLAPDAVLALGDLQYDDGRYPKFTRSYAKSWGAFKSITYPVPGNHEYWGSPRARGYFDYFGSRAGTPRQGWYSVELGSWHVVALNSNCAIVGCGKASAQYRWLANDLEASSAVCTLAFWHQPRFSSGPHGPDPSLSPLWRLLDRRGADVVLSGHDHIYERFRKQDASGRRDPQGVRSFVVGTGGAERYWIESVQPNSESRRANTFGVLHLTLGDGSYGWELLPAPKGKPIDPGSANCV